MAPLFFNTPDDPIEAPETVPPQYALGVREELSTMGNSGSLNLLKLFTQRYFY